MRSNICLLTLLIMILSYGCRPKTDQIISLDHPWKFKTGDSLVYAQPEWNDSSWDSIMPDKVWEEQGHADYDGFAWYRTHFFLSRSMQRSAFFRDSIEFVIGKIDDDDETYLNGKLLGQEGETIKPDGSNASKELVKKDDAWKMLRRYIIPVSDPRLKWDQDNVLAVRVFDHSSGGGLYGQIHEISMLDLKDFVSLNTDAPKKLNGKNQFSQKVTICNTSSSYTLSGRLNYKVITPDNQQTMFDTTIDLTVSTKSDTGANITFQADQSQRHTIYVTFTDHKSGKTFKSTAELPYILTPQPSDKPKINGAKVVGVRPGHDLLFYIPVTGLRPLKYQVKDLPSGFVLDTISGIITGKTKNKGEYNVTITVSNAKGTAERELKIMVGDQIALTPPLGWNSWNCWGLSVDDAKVRAAVDQFVATGLIDHGWTYVNIDDGWEAPKRNPNGEIQPNEKFPKMKALTNYVHSKGMKMGIYSSPGPMTCGGFLATYQHEMQDAKSWADWGIDYIKYDWCSYGSIAKDNSLDELKKPYILMRKCLDKVNRDIVFSLCQYGMGDVWKWGGEIGGNSWRTTGDITDTWESMSTIGFSQNKCYPYGQPGNWNDADMLVVGWVGWGPSLHPTGLTPSEQYTHISLWSLLSAPLLIGCDLTKLDDFTLNLLSNDEVLAVDQDPLGKPAVQVKKSDTFQIWAKTLEDGSVAVGLFNTDLSDQVIPLNFSDISWKGEITVRDLWRQKDLGQFKDTFETKVPGHGVVLIKLEK